MCRFEIKVREIALNEIRKKDILWGKKNIQFQIYYNEILITLILSCAKY